jgi:hypothetical protein
MPPTRRSRTLALAASAALVVTGVCGGAVRAEVRTAAGTGDGLNAVAAPPRTPMIFGTAAPSKQNLLAQEAIAGRPIVAVRVYRLWGDRLFGPDQIWMRDTYHTIFLSIKARRADGTAVPWADIAAATPGTRLYADMQDIAAQIKAFGARVFLTFNHEPEASASSSFGTGPEFAAAFRRFVSVMRAEQVGNMVPTAIFTGYGFTRTDAKSVTNFYPGDAFVSVVGIDVYNWGSCRNRPWTSLAQSLESARQWGLAHPSIPLMLTEWGSVEDPAVPGRKAQWLTDAGNLFSQPGYGQFAGVFAWGALNPNTACPFGYDTSQSASAAWAGIGREPAFSAWE